jgi:hypothetical protein
LANLSSGIIKETFLNIFVLVGHDNPFRPWVFLICLVMLKQLLVTGMNTAIWFKEKKEYFEK